MNNKSTLLLFLILLLGAVLRAYAIGSESFWIDEGLEAMVHVKYGGLEILKNVYLYGQILPGYYPGVSDLPLYDFTLEYWTRLWGISETSLRLYSALFGVLTIIFVFLTAKQLFGLRNAILSAFLFSISIPAIYYSQEARPYALYLFLSVASIYYFINSLKSNKNYYWAMYLLFTLLGLYTHYLFEILLIFQIFYLTFYLIIIRGYSLKVIVNKLLKNKGGIVRKIFYIYLIMLIISAPLIPRTFREGNAEAWRTAPTIETTAKIFVNFSTWIYPSEVLRQKIKSMSFFDMTLLELLLILSVGLTVIFSYSLIAFFIYLKLRKSKLKKFIVKEQSTVLLSVWFAFPILISFIFSISTNVPIFGPVNYLLYCIPPFIILLSEGILSFKSKYLKFLLVFFIAINILPLHAYYANVDKQEWRELAEYMKEKVKEDEIVLTSLYSGAVSLMYYYNPNADNIYGVVPDTQKKAEKILYLQDAKDMLKTQDRFWLVLSFWKYYDPQGLIQGYVNQNYETLETKSFFDIDAYYLQKKNST